MTQKIKRGVSLYSFQNETYLGKMSLDQAIGHCAAFGARGIEVVGEQTFAGWPECGMPEAAIADWHRHLYLTNNTLREVAPDEVLLLGDTAEDLPVAAPIHLQPGGLATEQTRYAAILPRDNLHHLATTAAVFIYQPITARLRNPAQRA